MWKIINTVLKLRHGQHISLKRNWASTRPNDVNPRGKSPFMVERSASSLSLNICLKLRQPHNSSTNEFHGTVSPRRSKRFLSHSKYSFHETWRFIIMKSLLPLISILSQTNPVNTTLHYFSKIQLHAHLTHLELIILMSCASYEAPGQFYHTSYHFTPLQSQYSPQHCAPKHSQSMFLPLNMIVPCILICTKSNDDKMLIFYIFNSEDLLIPWRG
jgi:hypothetical protein